MKKRPAKIEMPTLPKWMEDAYGLNRIASTVTNTVSGFYTETESKDVPWDDFRETPPTFERCKTQIHEIIKDLTKSVSEIIPCNEKLEAIKNLANDQLEALSSYLNHFIARETRQQDPNYEESYNVQDVVTGKIKKVTSRNQDYIGGVWLGVVSNIAMASSVIGMLLERARAETIRPLVETAKRFMDGPQKGSTKQKQDAIKRDAELLRKLSTSTRDQVVRCMFMDKHGRGPTPTEQKREMGKLRAAIKRANDRK